MAKTSGMWQFFSKKLKKFSSIITIKNIKKCHSACLYFIKYISTNKEVIYMFHFSESIEKLQDYFLYKKEIQYWINNVYKPACIQLKIENFHEFIWKDWNGFCSSTFGLLSTAPEILLANTQVFRSYYNAIDYDFKHDIMKNSFIFYLRKISLNKRLKKYLNNIIMNELKIRPILE